MPFGRSDDRLAYLSTWDSNAYFASSSSRGSYGLGISSGREADSRSLSPAGYRQFLRADIPSQAPGTTSERGRVVPPRQVLDLRDMTSASSRDGNATAATAGYPSNPFLNYIAPGSDRTGASSYIREVMPHEVSPDPRSIRRQTPPRQPPQAMVQSLGHTPSRCSQQKTNLAESIDGLKQDGLERVHRLEDGLGSIRRELAQLCGRRMAVSSECRREQLESALMELRPACEELENVELLARTAAQRCESHRGTTTEVNGLAALQQADHARRERLSSLEVELKRLLQLEAELPKTRSELARAVLKENAVREELVAAQEERAKETNSSSCSRSELIDVRQKISTADELLNWHREALYLAREELSQAAVERAQCTSNGKDTSSIRSEDERRVASLQAEVQRLKPLEKQLLEAREQLAHVAEEGRRSRDELSQARGQLSAAEANWTHLREELACARGELQRRTAQRAAAESAATVAARLQRQEHVQDGSIIEENLPEWLIAENAAARIELADLATAAQSWHSTADEYGLEPNPSDELSIARQELAVAEAERVRLREAAELASLHSHSMPVDSDAAAISASGNVVAVSNSNTSDNIIDKGHDVQYLQSSTAVSSAECVSASCANASADESTEERDAVGKIQEKEECSFGFFGGSSATTEQQSSFGLFGGSSAPDEQQSSFGFFGGSSASTEQQSSFGVSGGDSAPSEQQSSFGFFGGSSAPTEQQSSFGLFGGSSEPTEQQSGFGISDADSAPREQQSSFGLFGRSSTPNEQQSSFGFSGGDSAPSEQQSDFGFFGGSSAPTKQQSSFGLFGGSSESTEQQSGFGISDGDSAPREQQSSFGLFGGSSASHEEQSGVSGGDSAPSEQQSSFGFFGGSSAPSEQQSSFGISGGDSAPSEQQSSFGFFGGSSAPAEQQSSFGLFGGTSAPKERSWAVLPETDWAGEDWTAPAPAFEPDAFPSTQETSQNFSASHDAELSGWGATPSWNAEFQWPAATAPPDDGDTDTPATVFSNGSGITFSPSNPFALPRSISPKISPQAEAAQAPQNPFASF